MLVTFNEILPKAYREQYAVGCFLAYNLETLKIIIETAVEENAPVIVAISEKGIKYAGLQNYSAVALDMAERANVPVVITLDHGRHLDIIQKCLANNFSSIMIDVSDLPENDKILTVKKVVAWAEKYGVTVEGERDGLAGKEDGISGQKDIFTNPETAAVFVKETDIDVFAPSIGNIHGKRIEGEKLNIELLGKINDKLHLPLALHGASSTPATEIHRAINQGIAKINIDTDLRQAFISTLTHQIKMNSDIHDPREILLISYDAMRLVVKSKIRLFGSNGRA